MLLLTFVSQNNLDYLLKINLIGISLNAISNDLDDTLKISSSESPLEAMKTSVLRSIRRKKYTHASDYFVPKLGTKLNDTQIAAKVQKKNFMCDPRNERQDYSCLKNYASWRKTVFRSSPSVCLTDPISNKKHVVYYHTFWQLKGDQDEFANRLPYLNIMSYLATQNLICTKLIVWKLNSFPNSPGKRIKKDFSEKFKSKILEFRLINF